MTSAERRAADRLSAFHAWTSSQPPQHRCTGCGSLPIHILVKETWECTCGILVIAFEERREGLKA